MTLHQLFKKHPGFTVTTDFDGNLCIEYCDYVKHKHLQVQSYYDDTIFITYKENNETRFSKDLSCSHDRKEELVCELAYAYYNYYF